MFYIFLFLITFQFKSIYTINHSKDVRLDISPRMPQVNLPEGERHLLTCSGGGQGVFCCRIEIFF